MAIIPGLRTPRTCATVAEKTATRQRSVARTMSENGVYGVDEGEAEDTVEDVWSVSIGHNSVDTLEDSRHD